MLVQSEARAGVERPACVHEKRVVVTFTGLTGYPTGAPFDPPERYPEYALGGVNPQNQVYAEVRQTLHRLGLDQKNFNTPEWNPLGEIVQPGTTVLIKPNLVLHQHLKGKDVFSVIIHASVVRPILDYVCRALKNRGRIILGDSQQMFALFEKTLEVSQLGPLLHWYRQQASIPIEWMDLRKSRGVRTWLWGQWGRTPVEADPRGYQVVDLGKESHFEGVDAERLRISLASYQAMRKHHSPGRHEYVFPRSVLESDTIINIAKMKTHRRTGVSLALKNLVGLPATKECLPHYRIGSPEEGGDEYIHRSWRKRACTRLQDQVQTRAWVPVKFVCAALRSTLWESHRVVPFRDNIDEAMWYGNDTLWRMVLDLNRAAFYADKQGKLCPSRQRRSFCLLDGIIAGENNGPLAPNPVAPGVLMAGINPVAFDAVAACLMGFDIDKIPHIKKGLEEDGRPQPLYGGTRDTIEVVDREAVLSLASFQRRRNLKFDPHPNWRHHIERE